MSKYDALAERLVGGMLQKRGGSRLTLVLQGLRLLSLGVAGLNAYNAWVTTQDHNTLMALLTSLSSIGGLVGAAWASYILRGERPARIEPVQQAAQRVLHQEALDRNVSLADLMENGAAIDPVSLEPFAVGDRVVILRPLEDRGPILPAQIMSETSWNRLLEAGYVRNPTTREPVTDSYVTLVGAGRQHNPFPYSKPDLPPDEKAQERSAHYRQLHRGVRLQHIKARKGKEGEKEEPGKKSFTYNGKLVVMEVIPDEPYKKLVDVRGLKEPKKTLPKEGSERKPYVGKVMKQKLFQALGLDEDSKEGKTALRVASRLYKQGKGSWEDILLNLQS